MAIRVGGKLKLTYSDYLGFPDNRTRHELIDGEHYVTASPSTYHQKLSLRLGGELNEQVEKKGRGEVNAAAHRGSSSIYELNGGFSYRRRIRSSTAGSTGGSARAATAAST